MFGMQWWKEQLFEVVEGGSCNFIPKGRFSAVWDENMDGFSSHKGRFSRFGMIIRRAVHPKGVFFRDLG